MYTETYKLVGEFEVGTGAGNTQAAFMVKPNPYLSVIDTQRWLGGSQCVNLTSPLGWTTYANNASFKGACDGGGSVLSATMRNYRVVSHGIRIKMVTPLLAATGRIIIAAVPRGHSDPPGELLGSRNWLASNATPLIMDLPIVAAVSPFLLESPASFECSLADLVTNDITVINKPNSMQAFDFKTTSNSVNIDATWTLADTTMFNGGTYAGSGNYDSPMGWNDFYFYLDGCPLNQPILTVQWMCHIEGTPSLASTSGISPVPSHAPPPKNTFPGIDTVLRFAAQNKDIIIDAVSNTFTPTSSNHPTMRLMN